MGDKDVERNVRSTTEDGIRTPTPRHIGGIAEEHSITFGEKTESKKTKQTLLDKFKRREQEKRGTAEREVEPVERGAGATEDPED
ncbi:MAG TPA: hypothetical protein VIK15_09875 [Candidatus Anoxymicrobiaceae bacterium]|jgi:hypothetical protein